LIGGTVRASPGEGAVTVRPTRLPSPLASAKRYQYSVAGVNPPTSTRQVQSESADILVLARAIRRLKFLSSATSSVTSGMARTEVGGQRVHKITLSACGSPEATPCGNRSRFSRHEPAGRKKRVPLHA
jgi:hypothetical protein